MMNALNRMKQPITTTMLRLNSNLPESIRNPIAATAITAIVVVAGPKATL